MTDKNTKTPEEIERINRYIDKLKKSHNIIFHGAPGTGKSYLAKEIAAQMLGIETNDLKDSRQFEFVQFHPSYDYTDFVEGLRPVPNKFKDMGFELQPGTFMEFVNRARADYKVIQDMAVLKNYIDANKNKLKGKNFTIAKTDATSIAINADETEEQLSLSELRKLVRLNRHFNNASEIQKALDTSDKLSDNPYDYYLSIANYLFNHKKEPAIDSIYAQLLDNHLPDDPRDIKQKKTYVFVIDEINRGEISKVFGELFYCLDPNLRGPKGAVKTQYANMHYDVKKNLLPDFTEDFYIPDNVYIIGTMNDIDRSVDTFDFAMRRRFRFIEINPEDSLFMWNGVLNKDEIEQSKKRLKALNNTIEDINNGLNRTYDIGPSYFLYLKDLRDDKKSTDEYESLWSDYLEPLLQSYFLEDYDKDKHDLFHNAYRIKTDEKPAGNEGE